MPIYEYLCDKCERDDIELLIRNDEQPQCPSCGSKRLTKKLSVPAAYGTRSDLSVLPPGGG